MAPIRSKSSPPRGVRSANILNSTTCRRSWRHIRTRALGSRRLPSFTTRSDKMQLESVFYVSIYGLVALGGAMIAYGEETPFPVVLTVPLAVLAVFFNERIRKIRINLLTSNLLGLAAAGITVFEIFDDSLEARLLAGAHF